MDRIKNIYDNAEQDYITDGQRQVFVKSYKKWTPEDLAVIQKQDAGTLRFLNQAIAYKRLDVLKQLLPDHYRNKGGVQAFADDIKRAGTQKKTEHLP